MGEKRFKKPSIIAFQLFINSFPISLFFTILEALFARQH